MIQPQRLPDGSGYAVVCPHCGKGYSVETKNIDPSDPVASVNCEPLPRGAMSVRLVGGKVQLLFTCPSCGAAEQLNFCKNC